MDVAAKCVGFALALAVLGLSALAGEGEPQKLHARAYRVCGLKLSLEEARTSEERATGLMHRKGVPAGTGMIFIFPRARVLEFWMKNVPFPIDIAYFDGKGRLLRALSMAGTSPVQREETLPRYSSQAPALYAVEGAYGIFKALRPGCRLEPLPPRASE